MTVLKDSGQREQFPTGAQRDVQTGKPRIDLISPIFMRRLGVWLARGAEKYDARNWEKGLDNERCMASLMRHINQYREGERDEDHLAAAAFNLMALIHNGEMVIRGLLPRHIDNLPSYLPKLNRIYIAGPMRGYKSFNFAAFDLAAALWRSRGWEVISPADMDRAIGFDPDKDAATPEFLEKAMKRDMEAILDCDAIAMLPNWRDSEGAMKEYDYARKIGLFVFDAVTGETIPE